MDCFKIAFTSQTMWSGCLLLFSVSSWSYVINELKDYEGKDRLQFNCVPKQTEYERQRCYGNYTSAMSPCLTPLDFARLSFGLSGVGWVLFTLNAAVMIRRIRKATNTERQRTFKKQLKCRFIVNICYQSVLLVVMIVLFCLYQKLKYPAEYSCNQAAVNITCNDLRYKEKSNLNSFIVGIFSGSIFLCVVTIIHVAVSRDEILDLFLGKLAPDLNSEENRPLQATANRQQTADANGSNPGVPPASELSPPSNGPDDEDGDARVPVHVDQDDGHTRTDEERDHPGETVVGDPPQDLSNSTGNQSYENLPVSEKDKSLLDDLAVRLDKTAYHVVKYWEHLANIPEINAPLHVRLRCRIRPEGSCTLLLFDVLRAEFAEKSLGNMIDALEEIKRRDVKTIITDHCIRVCPNAAWRTMNFWEFDSNNRELVYRMAGLLDQKADVSKNWRNLGSSDQFRLSQLRLEEIEQSAQIGGQPTQILMGYLYTTIPELTIGTFYDKIKNFKTPTRKDVLKKLDQFMHESQISRNEPMKKAIDLHGDLMREICVLFNKQIPGVKNWRHLAKAFKVPEEVEKECEPGKPKSPTETLFQWIFAEKNPPLTVGQLCKALEGIGRNDLVKVVRDYFQQQ